MKEATQDRLIAVGMLVAFLGACLLAGCTQVLCSVKAPKCGAIEPPEMTRNSEGRCIDRVTGRYILERCCDCYLNEQVETDAEPRASLPTPTPEPAA